MRATYAPETGMQISGFSTDSEPRADYQNYILKIFLKEQTAENTKIGI